VNRGELDRPRLSFVWFSTSLYQPAARDELQEWSQSELGVDISGAGRGTPLELVHPWGELESQAWLRIEAAAVADFAEWCAAYRAATPPGHELSVHVGDSARVQGTVVPGGTRVSYPAARLVSTADPLAAVTEMVLTVVDKDVTKRGLGLASLRDLGLASLRDLAPS
jgi:hypothetical protein